MTVAPPGAASGPDTTKGVAPTASFRSDVSGHVAHTGAAPSPTLFHFTCSHAATDIVAVGALMPRRHPYLGALVPVTWLTTLEAPTEDDVGLTSRTLTCNRLAHRFRVIDHSTCIPWLFAREQAPPGAIPRDIVLALEGYGRPETWWISAAPVPVVPG